MITFLIKIICWPFGILRALLFCCFELIERGISEFFWQYDKLDLGNKLMRKLFRRGF
ncbi:MAG: hypothetical protein AAB516_00995 [Patescibacteria group bacterium]